MATARMKRGTVLLAAMLSCAAARAVSEQTPWPFITIRHTSTAARAGEDFRAVIDANARHPGSADAYWLGFRGDRAVPDLVAWLARYRPFLADMARAKIVAGSQQGLTLGHSHRFCAPKDVFPAAAWQVDRQGRPMMILCPRSPEVLAYEEAVIEHAVRTAGFRSVWLDDDLRMGGGKEEGCFCDRCLAAFNAAYGHALTRAELVARLDAKTEKEPLRRDWRLFKNDSLALYCAAARRGADRADPSVRLGYQSLDSFYLLAGENYLPLLKELAGTNGLTSAIRVGSGNYFESMPGNYAKSFSVMRESERCRRADFVGQISYEQETHTREVLHKSAEAVLLESAMALAAGADALTEYWWSADRPEPVSYYEEFAAMLAAWRPYLETLADISRQTSIAGLARFRGADYLMRRSDYFLDGTSVALGAWGIPMAVDDSPHTVWYVTEQTLKEWGAGDAARVATKGALVDRAAWDALRARKEPEVAAAIAAGRLRPFDMASVKRRGRTLPTHGERVAFLDAVEEIGTLPVRIDRAHPLYVFPRADAAGRVRAVSLFNGSIGRCLPTSVIVRRPAGMRVKWLRPEAEPVALDVRADGTDIHVTIPGLPACAVGTLVFF